uniref:Uncharacterized protein n=1 Tax=Panagrolaimus davidi TaxID=227884 RepID=A0A914R7W6_9BILA
MKQNTLFKHSYNSRNYFSLSKSKTANSSASFTNPPTFQPPPFTNFVEPYRYPMPNGIRNYPYNFSSLRLNGTRLLKPLNWYDKEIIQIIEDILDHDITVESALNRIYYITGDRPSKRIFQQRVRRHRENRMKQKTEETSINEENFSGNLKLATSKRIRAFYDGFLLPTNDTKMEKISYNEDRKLNKHSTMIKQENSNTSDIQALFDLNFGGYKTNEKVESKTELEFLFPQPKYGADEIHRNFNFSNNSNFSNNFCQHFNTVNPKMPSFSTKTFDKYPVNFDHPVFSPLDLQNERSDKTENFGFSSNFTKSNCLVPKIGDHYNLSNFSNNIDSQNYFPAANSWSSTQSPSYSSSTFQSFPGSSKSLYKNTLSKNDSIFSFPYEIPNSKSPEKEENHYGKIGFPITAERVDAMIDLIDHNWINNLLDETDISGPDDIPKILNPCNIKNICINIENILNFLQQSIMVFSYPNWSGDFMSNEKKWETFGEVFKDLLKLKDIFEMYENENTTAIIKRQSFIHDVIKWICGDSTMSESVSYENEKTT